jgi:hypothetical protein
MGREWQNKRSNRSNDQYKKSGATYSKIRQGKFEGMMIINAWNVSKQKGLITAKVAPYHASIKGSSIDYIESESAKYVKMLAFVEYKRTGARRVIPCLYNVSNKKIVLSDIGMIISPNGTGKTSSGKNVRGYFGKFL